MEPVILEAEATDQIKDNLLGLISTYGTKEELDEQMDIASSGSHAGARLGLVNHTDFIVLTRHTDRQLCCVNCRVIIRLTT